MSEPGRPRPPRRAARRHALRRRAAARGDRARPRAVAGRRPGRRADGEPRSGAHRQHHGRAAADQRGPGADAGRQPAPARDGDRVRDPHRRFPCRTRGLRWATGGCHAVRRRADLRRLNVMRRAIAFVALAALAWAAWDTGADPARLLRGLPWLLDFVRRMLPPDLRVLPAALAGAVTTVEIALLGTAVAAVLALPLGFLSARNVAAPPIFHAARVALNFFRSVDTLVYALVFVAAVGLGPFPGVLAVVAYTTTSLAKLYSEAIEGIEPGPVDAVTATGATRLQVLRYGVLPQVLPLFLSYVLYRLESNIRAATVLGFVGAGGIGFYLQTYLRMIDYPAASTVLLVTVLMVMAVDFVSSRLRQRLV